VTATGCERRLEPSSSTNLETDTEVGDVGCRRVGELVQRAAADAARSLTASGPRRVLRQLIHHQQPRLKVRRAAGPRPSPGR